MNCVLCLLLLAAPVEPPPVPMEPATAESLSGGVLHGPGTPEGYEWIQQNIRYEVERALDPLYRAIEGVQRTISGFFATIWRIICWIFWITVAIVVLLAVGVLIGFVMAMKFLVVLWRLGPLMTAASKALERFASTEK